jgi:uncharacterized membrane protein HdeD (DUF308 family)
MLHTVESILGLAFFIGWASLISGIFQVGFAISVKGVHNNWNLRLFNGIINILFGLIFLTHPALTAKALPFVFGFWMIFIGISTFFTGIRESNNNMPGGWFDMLLGLIITIGGIWISYNPMMEAAMLSWLLSLGFMFYGFYFVVVSLMISRIK